MPYLGDLWHEIAAVLTLAVPIGANAVVFAALHGLLVLAAIGWATKQPLIFKTSLHWLALAQAPIEPRSRQVVGHRFLQA